MSDGLTFVFHGVRGSVAIDRADSARYGGATICISSRLSEDHYLVLEGTEADSTDSRAVGWVAHGDLIGRATRVWWPLGRRRRLGTLKDTAAGA